MCFVCTNIVQNLSLTWFKFKAIQLELSSTWYCLGKSISSLKTEGLLIPRETNNLATNFSGVYLEIQIKSSKVAIRVCEGNLCELWTPGEWADVLLFFRLYASNHLASGHIPHGDVTFCRARRYVLTLALAAFDEPHHWEQLLTKECS